MTHQALTRLRSCGFILALGLLGSVLAASAGAALDADQQASLKTATANIKSAEADLNAARGSAGTAAKPAKGSRLKLTRMRLDQAIARLNTAAQALGKLPGDDADVKAAVAQHATAAASVVEIEAILSGGEAAAAVPNDAPVAEDDAPAASPAKKLHYQDEDKLKNGRFTLREANGYANAAAGIVARIDAEAEAAAEDQAETEKVVHKDVKDGLATLDTADRKYDQAAAYLDQLPADHPSVQAYAKELATTKANLGALRSRLAATDVELDKLTNLKHYPTYDTDVEMLNSFIGRYGNLQVQQPDVLVEVIQDDGNVLAEVQRIAKTYLPLVEQRTEVGAKLENRFNYFMQKRTAYVKEAQAYKEQLPGLIDADIAEAVSLAEQGVNEQKPMFFGPNSGIEQRLGWAEPKVAVLVAFDPEAGEPYQAKLAETRQQIDKMAESLSQQIIDANMPPNNNFQGEDRDAAIEIAIDGWKKQQPDAEVIEAYIPSKAWERETKWEWFAGAFHKVDRSTLQVQLLVKHDDELGIIRPLNVRKNHLKGDTLIAVPLWSFEDKVQPHSYLKLEKVE